MGAWIALRMAQKLNEEGEGDRSAALLLLAPAPDFTSELVEPKMSAANRRELEEKGYMVYPVNSGEDAFDSFQKKAQINEPK